MFSAVVVFDLDNWILLFSVHNRINEFVLNFRRNYGKCVSPKKGIELITTRRTLKGK